MLKSRMMFGVIALVMVLALAQSGYAQLQLSATNSAAGTEAANKETAFTSDPTTNVGLTITGTVMSDAPVTGGRLRITYPSTITNACFSANSGSGAGNNTGNTGAGVGVSGTVGGANNSGAVTYSTPSNCGTAFDQPAGDPIMVSFASGIFTGAGVVAVDGLNGRVDISLPCLAVSGSGGSTTTITNQTGTIILHGARIDASAISSFPATATLSLVSGKGIPGVPNGPGGAGGAGTATQANSICGTGTTTTNSNPSTTLTSLSPANILAPGNATVSVITASGAGIASVNTGGMPSSASTPADNTGSAGAVGTHAPLGTTPVIAGDTCSGSDAFHADCGVISINTNRNIPRGEGTFTVTEGFAYGWYKGDSAVDNLPGAADINDAAFTLTFNNIPAGITLTLQVAAFTSTTSPSGCPAAISTPGLNGKAPDTSVSVTTASNTVNVNWNNCLSVTSTDRVTFRVSVTSGNVPSSGTLAAGSITVSANMRPVAAALDLTTNAAGPTAIATYPRYASVSVGNATIANIVPANTTMLIPFAVTLAAAKIDTGIAIANTSMDPFTSGGATPQSGTVSFNFYATSNTGVASNTSFTTSTTKNPGGGFATDGTLAPGATAAVNLSNLLTLAGVTGDFSGYIFITTNFLPAHGAAFVYNPVSGGFAAYGAVPVFVLPNPATAARIGSRGVAGVEILDF